VKISEEQQANALICSLEGEININNSPELRKAFDAVIKRNELKIVVDFSGVSYIDSSGLATLIEMLQRLKKAGGAMRFCGMNENIKSVFEITKLHKLFQIFEGRDAALKDF